MRLTCSTITEDTKDPSHLDWDEDCQNDVFNPNTGTRDRRANILGDSANDDLVAGSNAEKMSVYIRINTKYTFNFES